MHQLTGSRRRNTDHPAFRDVPPNSSLAVVIVIVAIVVITAAAILQISGITGVLPTSLATPSRSAQAAYTPAQLDNAAAIIASGQHDQVPQHGIEIAVMTAMGESSLLNVNHGDEAGPDSIGLFQQRDLWGTREQRTNPVASAHLFYNHLLDTSNWQTMSPTLAAHAVQINADPNHYAKYWPAAVALVSRIEHHRADLIAAHLQ